MANYHFEWQTHGQNCCTYTCGWVSVLLTLCPIWPGEKKCNIKFDFFPL